MRGNVIVETQTQGIRVMRFTRPDMRKYLDEADTETSPLFREIQGAALSDLPEGWTLVINLGLIDLIGAAFYGCLLAIRKHLQTHREWLILCGLSPRHQEVFHLFRGPELFTIVSTEDEARRHVRERLSSMEMLRSQTPLRPARSRYLLPANPHLDGLQECRELRRLDVRLPVRYGWDQPRLNWQDGPPPLERLSVSGFRGTLGLAELANWPGLARLEWLELRSPYLGTAGFQLIQG
jgi:anti-anti-sigma regulatory factor